MPTLRPFRDYDEKDVINLYAYSGTLPVNKGTIVKIAGDGFRYDVEPIEMLGNVGDFSPSNFVSQRYGVVPKVTVADATGNALGMMLFDTRETDENGYPLKYNPRKAAEMEACISGQAVPIVTRGTFLYSGVITGTAGAGNAIVAGNPCYVGAAGVISAWGTTSSILTGAAATATGALVITTQRPIGKFLGVAGAQNSGALVGADGRAIALVWLNFV